MAAKQMLCKDMQVLRGSSTLRLVSRPEGDLQLLGDISTGIFRPLVPVCMQKQVFDSVHELAHLGTRATRRLLSARYVWGGMRRSCTTWVRDCITCQRSKVTHHVRTLPQHIPIPPAGSAISMWTWSGLYQQQVGTNTCLLL